MHLGAQGLLACGVKGDIFIITDGLSHFDKHIEDHGVDALLNKRRFRRVSIIPPPIGSGPFAEELVFSVVSHQVPSCSLLSRKSSQLFMVG